MKGNVFSNLVTLTNGLHRDNRSDREFELLNSELKYLPKTLNAFFKVNFKRPLNNKKEYYYKLILNNVENELALFVNQFHNNATEPENKYTYRVLYNKFDKYLRDIATYINKHGITADLTNDINYIINYLKVSAIHLYFELQEQYGQFSDSAFFSIQEIAEKYFNDTDFDTSVFVKLKADKKEEAKRPSNPKGKNKTSFGYLKNDSEWLSKILSRLQLSIDLLDAKTDVKDLHNLLVAQDFKGFQKKIYLDCKTTEFKYVIKRLQPHFKNLTPTLIESTGLFYTKLGKPLTAQNLYTKSTAPLKKEIIDNIFKQIQ